MANQQIKNTSAKIYRKLLQLIFGFDNWHISPLSERAYAVDIIKYCNSKKENLSFAEIGCGLGDIVRRVNYQKKIGYDRDEKVLKAASFLAGRKNTNIFFKSFHFPDDKLPLKLDALVMVNWIHLIPPQILQFKIEEYFNKNINIKGIIVIDTVKDKDYQYNHNISFLTANITCTIEKIGNYHRGREVWVIRK